MMRFMHVTLATILGQPSPSTSYPHAIFVCLAGLCWLTLVQQTPLQLLSSVFFPEQLSQLSLGLVISYLLYVVSP